MSKGAEGKNRDRAYLEWVKVRDNPPAPRAPLSESTLHGELSLGLQGEAAFLGRKRGKKLGAEKPMVGGQYVCRHWRRRFGWLNYRVGDRRAQTPAGCNRWECADCGPRKRAKLECELRTGMAHEGWGRRYRPALLTLTWRYKRKQFSPESRLAFATEQARERWHFGIAEWQSYITKQLHMLTERWAREWGERMVYFGTQEMTKQACPHLHLMVKPPIEDCLVGSAETVRVQRWLTEAWREITGDSHRADFKAFDPTRHSVGSGFGYIGKYITKEIEFERPDGFRYRRFRQSQRFPRAMVRAALAFKRTDAGGEVVDFDRWEHRRRTGRFYRARAKDRAQIDFHTAFGMGQSTPGWMAPPRIVRRRERREMEDAGWQSRITPAIFGEYFEAREWGKNCLLDAQWIGNDFGRGVVSPPPRIGNDTELAAQLRDGRIVRVV